MSKVLRSATLGFVTLAALSGCTRKTFEVPEFAEEPEVVEIKKQDFVETAPAYGIYSAGSFQVNVEAEDAPKVQVGTLAVVQPIPGKTKVRARVSRILRSVTAETRQGIAWLQPLDPAEARRGIREGDFVFAVLTLRVKHEALSIPRNGLFIKDSKTWAIVKGTDEKGKVEYRPTEVEVGTSSMERIEVLKGLADGQSVATSGAIGFLYPEFKAAGD